MQLQLQEYLLQCGDDLLRNGFAGHRVLRRAHHAISRQEGRQGGSNKPFAVDQQGIMLSTRFPSACRDKVSPAREPDLTVPNDRFDGDWRCSVTWPVMSLPSATA